MWRLVAQTQPRHMQREGQPLGRTDLVMASYLSHPRASDVSGAGRSGVMPIQRREAWSELDHTARIPPSALSPV